MSNPDQPPPVAPPTNMPPPAADATTTVVDRLFPSQNGNALLSYYLGLFAIIPCAGLLLGPVSLVAGGRALKAVKETPGMPGKTHAVVGIGCGAIGLAFNLLIVLFVIAAWNSSLNTRH